MHAFARLALVCAALGLASATAHAQAIAAAGTEGLVVKVAETGHVFATYQGSSGSFTNVVSLNGTDLFTTHISAPGAVLDLGVFTAGTVLDFSMLVQNTGNVFHMGEASRNPDNAVHARAQADWQPGVTLISFEDLVNGDFNYGDLSLSVSNTLTSPVPEPGVLTLTASALILAGALRRQTARTR
jgi:hypothetical protein